jgi:hypothetical protein
VTVARSAAGVINIAAPARADTCPVEAAQRAWSAAPGPVTTLHPILEQIEDCAAEAGLSTPVFAAAKEIFDKALADGWGDLDIACVHDQVRACPPSARERPHDLVAGHLFA